MSKGTTTIHRCGHVAIIGRPNVGKSTLVNRLVGQKFSITSRKAQTTRHRLLGIKTTADAQVVYVDTPGLHAGSGRALNRYMNRAASTALVGVDLILFLVEAGKWTDGDRINDKQVLLPFIDDLSRRGEFLEVVPISALQGTNTDRLEEILIGALPETAALYGEDQFTDRSERFLAAELVREKLTDRLGQELPYRLSVEIEAFQADADMLRIGAVIWVERSSQKGIVIGRQGRVLKAVGSDARKDMEALFERKVFLELWVKVKEGWSNDEQALQRLGYVD
jgi:GTP-binding protein Era